MTGMKRAAFAAAAAVAAASAFAAVPVAKGFAEWTCLDAKHHLSGRTLYPGDMRGRVAVVVVSDAANLKKALLDYGMLQTLADTTLKVVSWDTYWPKGDVVVMFSVAGGGGDEAVAEFLKAKDLDPKDLERLRRDISVYDGATFHGAPAVAGGYPYVYVLAPGAAEPLLAEKCDKKKTLANVKAAVAKGCKLLKPRKPYFGEVEEPKFYPQLAKSLETGKPAFGQVLGQIQKGVTSSNAEQAKEAQLLLDAFDQRRSDLEFVINKCVYGSPHVAYAHIHELTQRWPAAKAALAGREEGRREGGHAHQVDLRGGKDVQALPCRPQVRRSGVRAEERRRGEEDRRRAEGREAVSREDEEVEGASAPERGVLPRGRGRTPGG